MHLFSPDCDTLCSEGRHAAQYNLYRLTSLTVCVLHWDMQNVCAWMCLYICVCVFIYICVCVCVTVQQDHSCLFAHFHRCVFACKLWVSLWVSLLCLCLHRCSSLPLGIYPIFQTLIKPSLGLKHWKSFLVQNFTEPKWFHIEHYMVQFMNYGYYYKIVIFWAKNVF
jgi:hypothetical protein